MVTTSLLKFEAFIQEAFHIWQAWGALVFLLEPQGRGEERSSVGLFYYLNTLSMINC